MNLLAFDTSTDVGSVALVQDGILLAEQMIRSPMNLLTWLSPTIQKMLKEAGISPDKLNGLAVGIGPGSFTGIRLQMSTARAFAQVRKVPLYGISGLETLAYQILPYRGYILSCIDARRGELFYGIFEANGDALTIKEEFGCLPPDRVLEKAQKYQGEWIIVGETNPYLEFLLKGLPHSLYANRIGIIRASTIGILAYQKKDQLNGDPFSVQPLYLRASNAEIEKRA